MIFYNIEKTNDFKKVIIEVTNVRNNKGNILISIFEDEESFKKKAPIIQKNYPKEDNLKGNYFNCILHLHKGIYGVVILDDENKDRNMNYNFFGLPKEGYGFSNYYHSGLKRPLFSDFDFLVSDQKTIIKVKLKYF